ncbi:MAG TPA: NADH-quinone oxidoreductase subunit J [Verrucomicrobiae bacterium]|jgi:NADH-quinone oxidoreductase subunit J|nr:NADH-quinone oxidoreductase subunit J [Verrucomicrobiae bacterium]
MLAQILFFIFAAMCVGGAINLLVQKHPINSALSLIVVMGSLALIYLLLGAEFLAAVQVIVYAGAVMVLFVFVIMLLNAGEEERLSHGSRVAILLGVPALIIGLGIAAWFTTHITGLDRVAIGGPEIMNGTDVFGNPQAVGKLLFSTYLLPFEVTSVLLLIAIMGAVVLARREGD